MVALTRGSRSPAVAMTAVCAAVFIGAAGLVAGGSGDARAAGGAAVIEEGELDLVPRIVDGALKLEIDDRSGGAPKVRTPSQVVVHAGPATKETVVSPAYPILGELVDAYFLNGFFNSGQIYAPEPVWKGGESGGGSEVGLTGFEGPGRFALYAYTPEMDSDDEPAVPYLGSDADAPRSFALSADEGGMKPTWAFTEEGVYRLTFTVTKGELSATETLAVVVGDDVDPSGVIPGDGSEPAEPSATPPVSPSATPTRPAAHVIDNGHLDLAARPADDGLSFEIKEGSAQVHSWYEPDEVVLHVKPAARRKVAEGYEFVGDVGSSMWLLPMQQIDGLVWPGWSTEEFATSDVRGDVSFSLDSAEGPGSVAVFSTGATGSVTIGLDSRDGLPDVLAHSAHAHSHWNWAFTAEGVYRTTFTVSATLADGRTVRDTETLAWVVGNGTDPSAVVPGDGGEPTSSPTATPTPSASEPTSAPSSTPSPPGASGSAGPEGGSATATSSSAVVTGPAAGSGAVGAFSDPRPAGGLASTGSSAAVIAGIALAATAVGGGVFAAARRRRAVG